MSLFLIFNIDKPINPLSANPQNGQTHSNNSSANCLTIFWGGA